MALKISKNIPRRHLYQKFFVLIHVLLTKSVCQIQVYFLPNLIIFHHGIDSFSDTNHTQDVHKKINTKTQKIIIMHVHTMLSLSSSRKCDLWLPKIIVTRRQFLKYQIRVKKKYFNLPTVENVVTIVLLLTVRAQMKCRIMRYFIRFYTLC